MISGQYFLIANQFYFIMEVDSHPERHSQHPQHDHQGKKLKCVCELCTCGKHHCPRPRIKGNFSTSYADHYQKLTQEQKGIQRPQYQYQERHYSPEVMKTNYQDNFFQPPVSQANPQSPSRFQSVGNKLVYKVPFTGGSSYKQQFKPFGFKPTQPEEVKPMQQIKPQSVPVVPRSPVKFQGVSSYKQQFLQPPKVQSKPVPQTLPTYQKVNIPFYGSSSYKNQFQDYKFQPQAQKSMELSPSPKRQTVKFDGKTSYNDQFQGYKLMMPQQEHKVPQCVVDKLSVPPINYVNDEKHIYYDPEIKKFI